MTRQPGDDECAPLTRRLAELLELRGHGWSYDEIGAEYGLQGTTVRAYLRHARLLLGAGTADEAIRDAARRGIIELGGQGQLHPRPQGPRWAIPEPASVAIRFVGGPADGRTLAIPGSEPPPLYRIPITPSIAESSMASLLSPEPSRAAEYEPLRDGGQLRRADDGAYLYEHRAAPLNLEQRRSVERAREEAGAARQQRDAELDEAWRRIREERPHYPADWRDLS
ncbi:hypothetical protein [Streptomyces sp. NPDC050416]|uniref:hypothetical protein n=1 Tax=Streptomyces sp. NPDC050416 TaxID=3365611 RepID=UPI00378E27A8